MYAGPIWNPFAGGLGMKAIMGRAWPPPGAGAARTTGKISGSARRRKKDPMSQPSSTRELWTVADVPDQAGRTVVITGANSGIGFEAARGLAEHGAAVILACRDGGRGRDAAVRIAATAPQATMTVVHLDLASLASVREAAEEIRGSHVTLDLLINNAGLMFP